MDELEQLREEKKIWVKLCNLEKKKWMDVYKDIYPSIKERIAYLQCLERLSNDDNAEASDKDV